MIFDGGFFFLYNNRKISYFIYQKVLRLVVSRIDESSNSWNHQDSFIFYFAI